MVEELLRTHYDAMKRYFAYLESRAKDGIVSDGLGDWYDLGPKKPGAAQLTPPPVTATAFYYHNATVLARVAELIGKLKAAGIKGLVIDLRRNGGGLLSEAVSLTGLFIDQGPVVQVRDSMGRIQVDSDTEAGVAYDGPLAVLTSRFSASASEIFAGALQNYGRAVIIGDATTHGKGTVQAVLELKNFLPRLSQNTGPTGAAKLTIQKFYLPNGASTQKKGVVPDITCPQSRTTCPSARPTCPTRSCGTRSAPPASTATPYRRRSWPR